MSPMRLRRPPLRMPPAAPPARSPPSTTAQSTLLRLRIVPEHAAENIAEAATRTARRRIHGGRLTTEDVAEATAFQRLVGEQTEEGHCRRRHAAASARRRRLLAARTVLH